MDKKILTLTELAKFLNINKRTFYRRIQSNDFPVRPIPRTNPRKWSVDDVNRWLAGKYE